MPPALNLAIVQELESAISQRINILDNVLKPSGDLQRYQQKQSAQNLALFNRIIATVEAAVESIHITLAPYWMISQDIENNTLLMESYRALLLLDNVQKQILPVLIESLISNMVPDDKHSGIFEKFLHSLSLATPHNDDILACCSREIRENVVAMSASLLYARSRLWSCLRDLTIVAINNNDIEMLANHLALSSDPKNKVTIRRAAAADAQVTHTAAKVSSIVSGASESLQVTATVAMKYALAAHAEDEKLIYLMQHPVTGWIISVAKGVQGFMSELTSMVEWTKLMEKYGSLPYSFTEPGGATAAYMRDGGMATIAENYLMFAAIESKVGSYAESRRHAQWALLMLEQTVRKVTGGTQQSFSPNRRQKQQGNVSLNTVIFQAAFQKLVSLMVAAHYIIGVQLEHINQGSNSNITKSFFKVSTKDGNPERVSFSEMSAREHFLEAYKLSTQPHPLYSSYSLLPQNNPIITKIIANKIFYPTGGQGSVSSLFGLRDSLTSYSLPRSGQKSANSLSLCPVPPQPRGAGRGEASDSSLSVNRARRHIQVPCERRASLAAQAEGKTLLGASAANDQPPVIFTTSADGMKQKGEGIIPQGSPAKSNITYSSVPRVVASRPVARVGGSEFKRLPFTAISMGVTVKGPSTLGFPLESFLVSPREKDSVASNKDQLESLSVSVARNERDRLQAYLTEGDEAIRCSHLSARANQIQGLPEPIRVALQETPWADPSAYLAYKQKKASETAELENEDRKSPLLVPGDGKADEFSSSDEEASEDGSTNGASNKSKKGKKISALTLRREELKKVHDTLMNAIILDFDKDYIKRSQAASVIRKSWLCTYSLLGVANRRQVFYRELYTVQRAAAMCIVSRIKTFLDKKRFAKKKYISHSVIDARIDDERSKRRACLRILAAMQKYVKRKKHMAYLMKLLSLENETKLLKYEVATFIIQRWWPLALTEKKYRRQINAGFVAQHAIEAERLREDRNALIIQRLWRGALVRSKQEYYKERAVRRRKEWTAKVRDNVDVICIFLQEYAARQRRLQRELDACRQKMDLQLLNRERLQKEKLYYRGMLEAMLKTAQRQLRRKALRMHKACIIIQRAYRRFRARRELRVQLRITKAVEKNRIEDEKRVFYATLTIQKWWRIVKSKREECQREMELRQFLLTLSPALSGINESEEEKCEKERHKWADITEVFARAAVSSRVVYSAEHDMLDELELKVHTWYVERERKRELMRLIKIAQMELRCDRAAVIIQHMARSYNAKRATHRAVLQAKSEEQCVIDYLVKIQSFVRMVIVKKMPDNRYRSELSILKKRAAISAMRKIVGIAMIEDELAHWLAQAQQLEEMERRLITGEERKLRIEVFTLGWRTLGKACADARNYCTEDKIVASAKVLAMRQLLEGKVAAVRLDEQSNSGDNSLYEEEL